MEEYPVHIEVEELPYLRNSGYNYTRMVENVDREIPLDTLIKHEGEKSTND